MNERNSAHPSKQERKARNLDPITDAPGSHPVGSGVGAAVGGAAGIGAAGAAAMTGTAIGTAAAGPVGAAVGLAVGAVIGTAIGRSAAEKIDPTQEDFYWNGQYKNEPYYNSQYTYEDYGPVYGVGVTSALRYDSADFESIESNVREDYERLPNRKMEWDEARVPAKSAWQRVKERLVS